jgi:nucleotide-binding universal stress UspA family protein
MGLAMRDPYVPPPAVVVGFDGSRSAMQAALWAVDEAVDRDVVLQLVYAIDSPESAGACRNAELATAERVVHQASTAIESTGKPVKLEADIVHATRSPRGGRRRVRRRCFASARPDCDTR